LKRAGSNFKGLSPFSDELHLRPLKGFGKILVLEKGNSVAFVMEHEHFTYPEAILSS
jgi:DNA primase